MWRPGLTQHEHLAQTAAGQHVTHAFQQLRQRQQIPSAGIAQLPLELTGRIHRAHRRDDPANRRDRIQGDRVLGQIRQMYGEDFALAQPTLRECGRDAAHRVGELSMAQLPPARTVDERGALAQLGAARQRELGITDVGDVDVGQSAAMDHADLLGWKQALVLGIESPGARRRVALTAPEARQSPLHIATLSMKQHAGSDASFGAWVRRRRRALDLTQARLGELAACTESAIRKIEADERRPSRRIAERLAHALRIPEDEHACFVESARGDRCVDRLEDDDVSSVRERIGNLSDQVIDLFGREVELEAVQQRLADASCRLLTVTGPGGIGKTKLAVTAAARACRMFLDGTWAVYLAAVESKDVLLSVLAHALGLVLSSDTDAQRQLHAYLRDKRALLLLDNFEQLLPATQAVAALLDAAPHIKMLVTSRERLNLSEEWLLPLKGLGFAAELNDIAIATSTPAVRLFRARAQRVRPEFPDDELEEAARICRALEGTPLAIELAAAWTRLLPCADILREIERNLDFLRTAARDVPARQASLRAAFDHSMALLTEEERAAFARLSVFRGAFDREAAWAVAGAGLPLLGALADKSLLRQASEGRLAIHELLRQFAGELLARDAAEHARVHAAHGRYFLDLVISQRDTLVGEQAPAVAARLAAGLADTRAAVHWALAARDYARLQNTLSSVHWVYELTSRFGEAIELAEEISKRVAADPRVETDQSAVLLASIADGVAGWFLLQSGRWTESVERSRAAIARLRVHEPNFVRRISLATFAVAAAYTGRREEALAALNEVRSNPIPKAWPGWLAQLHLAMALAYTALGELAQAERELQLALEVLRPLGQPWMLGSAHFSLGRVAMLQNRLGDSLIHSQQAMAAWQQLDASHPALVLAEAQLGRVALKRGDFATARAHFQRSLERAETLEYAPYVAHALAHLGRIDAAESRHDEALRRHQEALQMNRELGNRLSTVRSLLHCASTLKSLNQLAPAYAHWREAALLALDGGMIELARQAVDEMLAHAGEPACADPDMASLRHAVESLPATLPAKRALRG